MAVECRYMSIAIIFWLLSVMSLLLGMTHGLSPEPGTDGHARNTRPNIILLLADDMGYGDLGCYGNETVSTPHIDSLARDGLRFTRTYSQPVCSPARAAILTGRYPVRYGILSDHSASLALLRAPVFLSHAQPGGIPVTEKPTLADMLSSLQYKTALLGKWHLGSGKDGVNLPMSYGFQSFYGMPESHYTPCTQQLRLQETENYFFLLFFQQYVPNIAVAFLCTVVLWFAGIAGKKTFTLFGICIACFGFVLRVYLSFGAFSPKACILMANKTILEQPYKEENMTLRLTKQALEFISASAEQTQPFFLFMSYHQPHHPPHVSPWFMNRSGIGLYQDSVTEMDWSVGTIVRRLKHLGIEDNTLVIFASDNGAEETNPVTGVSLPPGTYGSPGHTRASNGDRVALRGFKLSVWEGGIRIPAIFKWPGVIAPGQTSQALTNLMDIFPTIKDIVGEGDLGKAFDGNSLLPILRDAETPSSHKAMMHYCDTSGVAAVSVSRYKAHFRSCAGQVFNPPLLFDMEKDPGESTPLTLSDHEGAMAEIREALARHQSSLTPYPSQLSQLFRPWNFLCSNPPFCSKVMEEEEHFDDLFV